MRKSVWFLACSLALSLHALTPPEDKQLKELIEMALKNNASIAIAQSQVLAKDAAVVFAKAGYLPQLSLQGEMAQYGIKNASLDDKESVTGASATVSQLLYDFGSTTGAIDASKSAYQASLKQLDTTIANVVIGVKKAYYTILNQHQLLGVAQEATSMDALQLEQAKAYFQAGVRTKIDVTNAELQLSNSQLELLKAQFDLESAQTALISLLGSEHHEKLSFSFERKDIIDAVKQMDTHKVDLLNLIVQGLQKRPEIDVYKANIALAEATLSSAHAEHYPKILLNASYDDKRSDLLSVDGRQTRIGLYIKWELFSGFSKEAKAQEALANLQGSKSELKNSELKIKQEISDAYLGLKRNEESAKMQLLSVELATQNLSLAQQRYKAGLSDMIELNDAKLQYTKSKSALVNAYYNYLIAVANIAYVSGVQKL